MSNDTAVLQMTVNEVIRRFPATVTLFGRWGIDACCGGSLPVGEAAARYGMDPKTVAAELERAIRDAA